jgi:hypothetical protein
MNSRLVYVAICLLGASAVTAGGLGEGRPWQFQTSADRANKAAVVDLIEKKRGGYYDGFNTYTYIGTQLNCTNAANATANVADNGQSGARTEANGSPTVSADSNANSDSTSSQSGAVIPASTGQISQSGTQTNSGDLDAAIDDTQVDSGFDTVQNGPTRQEIDNQQANSGNQDASIDTSTACGFDNSTLTGIVTSDAKHLN